MTCPFCAPDPARVFHDADPAALCIWDLFPVTPGHALVVPRRHVATWFDATRGEQASLLDGIEIARAEILKLHAPAGFNIGINIGAAAGQTVPHLHVHVIPRYEGDVEDPRGGVRWVIPDKANYLASGREARVPGPERPTSSTPPSSPRVVGSDTNPLAPHLLEDLARARAADLAIAFVLEAGLERVHPYLQDILTRGGQLRILTGDYLGVTEPAALRRLLDLEPPPDNTAAFVERRIFQTTETSFAEGRGPNAEGRGPGFHTKLWLLTLDDHRRIAYIGSSNLTRAALERGVESNLRLDSVHERASGEAVDAVADEFERLFTHPCTTTLTYDWITDYESRRPTPHSTLNMQHATFEVVEVRETAPEYLDIPIPNTVQREALDALSASRVAGDRAGLVVMATGLGKTWLAAFDSVDFKRVLFVAHREEILGQARDTFRRIRPDAHLGFYKGDERDVDADVLFASIQTLGKTRHLETFARDAFDYIVIDEFHHAAAATYRRLIDHFEPAWLLGLTATPERTDGGDLLTLCDGNLVYRCDLAAGITRELLAPFHYFGVPDDVDYANIPWRNARFDPAALEAAVATQRRADNALQQWRKHAASHSVIPTERPERDAAPAENVIPTERPLSAPEQPARPQANGGIPQHPQHQSRTLAFCVSQRHADFMAGHFRAAGVRCVAVHAGPSSAPRSLSLEQLASGELQVVFAVDMFIEGVDVPAIDTVMMLRPTESRIVWLQQLGRGLRKAEGKERLTVVDYIGNHRSFLEKPIALLGIEGGAHHVREALAALEAGTLELPPGCAVTYELEAMDILRNLIRIPRTAEALKEWYEDFRARFDVGPDATETMRAGLDPGSARRTYGSWLRFVDAMGDLGAADQAALEQAGAFLDALETTPMTRSYKMLVLLAMIAAGKFPGTIAIDELVREVRHHARRSRLLTADIGDALESDDALRKLLEDNPIAAWTGGAGTGDRAYFEYANGRFTTKLDAKGESAEAAARLAREVAEWRLARYLDRREAELTGAPRFVAKVSHASGRPMLFLPDREENPGIPEGWTRIEADGETYEANFVKVALNVVRKLGGPQNVLPDLLKQWFGEEAGSPGTHANVVFDRSEDGYTVLPLEFGDDGPHLWRAYMREEIPPLFGFRFNTARWNKGFVWEGGHMFLLCTLTKDGMPDEYHYTNRFLDALRFQWQSQNQTTQTSRAGQALMNHQSKSIDVHLFVRKGKKTGAKAAPFIYCGDVDFERWEGNKPITINWKMRAAVPSWLWPSLLISNE